MNPKLKQRILAGVGLGFIFGLLCFAGFSSQTNVPAEMARWQKWSLTNPWLWRTLTSRALLGFVIGMAGVFNRCPFTGQRRPAWLRGLKLGILVSLPTALGALTTANQAMAVKGFWIVLIAGGIIGLIIDTLLSKFIGNGENLRH